VTSLAGASARVAPVSGDAPELIVGPSRHLPWPLDAVARRTWDEASLFHRRYRHLLPPAAARAVAEFVERAQRPELALFGSGAGAAPRVLVASNDPLLRASLFSALSPAPDGHEAKPGERAGSLARARVEPRMRLDADVVALEIPSRAGRSFARDGWLVLPRWVALEVDLTASERELWDARKRETVRRIERSSLHVEVARGPVAAREFYEHLYAPTARARHGGLAIVVRFGHVEAAARVGYFVFVRDGGVRRAGLLVVPRPGRGAALDALLFGVAHGDYEATRLSREALYLFALRWARHEMAATRFGLTVAAPFASDGILRFKTRWGATALADPRQPSSVALRVETGSPELGHALAAHAPILLRQRDHRAELSVLAVRLDGAPNAAVPHVRGVTLTPLSVQSARELPRLLAEAARGA